MTTAATPHDLASDALVAQMSSRNEQLSSENRRLTDENRRLREQVAELEDAIGQLKSAAEARVAALVGALREARESFRVQYNANDPRNGPAADSLGRRIAEVALARIDRVLAGVEPASFDPLKCQRIPPSLLGTTGHVGDVLREALEELPDTHDRLGWIYVRCIREALRRLDACTPEPVPPAVTREQVEREIADAMEFWGYLHCRSAAKYIRSGAYRPDVATSQEVETPSPAPAETGSPQTAEEWADAIFRAPCQLGVGVNVNELCIAAHTMAIAEGVMLAAKRMAGEPASPQAQEPALTDRELYDAISNRHPTWSSAEIRDEMKARRMPHPHDTACKCDACHDAKTATTSPATSAPPCDECHGAGMVDHDVVGGDGSWGCSACNGTGVAPSAPEQAEPTSDPDDFTVVPTRSAEFALTAAGMWEAPEPRPSGDVRQAIAEWMTRLWDEECNRLMRQGGVVSRQDVLDGMADRIRSWPLPAPQSAAPMPEGWRDNIAGSGICNDETGEAVYFADPCRITVYDGDGYSADASRDALLHLLDRPPQSAAPSDEVEQLRAQLRDALGERDTPQTSDFLRAVAAEADHQVARWGSEHDAGKAPEDWFWLLGYLGGKALHAAKHGDRDKALHHTVSSAAALLNWHRALAGTPTAMRPGIEPPDGTAAPGAAPSDEVRTKVHALWKAARDLLTEGKLPRSEYGIALRIAANIAANDCFDISHGRSASTPATPQGAPPGLPALPDGWHRIGRVNPHGQRAGVTYGRPEHPSATITCCDDGMLDAIDPYHHITPQELHAVLSHHLGIAPPDPGKVSEAVALLRQSKQDALAADGHLSACNVLFFGINEALRLLAPGEG